VQAGIALGRSSLDAHHGAARWRAVAYAALGAVATIAVGPGVVLVLLGCGLAELAWRRRPGAAGSLSPAALVMAVATVPALAWTAFKVGALSYGGGFVIIPLMQADAVDTYGWMTDAEFANAVAYGQLTPGPVVHTVAMVGWAAAGLGGALFASAIAFAPSFLAVAALGDRFVRLRQSATARAFLDGAGPAAAGAILGAAVPLVEAIDETWQWALLIPAAALLLLRVPPIWVLLAGGVSGLATTL
jgi:chromate transporter